MMKKYVKSFTVFITLFALLSGVFFNTPVKNVDAANDPSTFSFWDFVGSEPEATAGDADIASLGDADIENLSATSSLFSDISPNSAGSYEAETIFNAGIISGFGRDSQNRVIFKPNKPVTRAQFALMLHRFIMFAKIQNMEYPADYKDYKISYKDVPSSGQFYEAIRFLDYYHIISGFSSTEYKPNNYITRAQISLIFMKLTRAWHISTTERENLSALRYPDVQSLSFDVRDSMSWTIKKGILSGIKKGQLTYLKGNDTATRLQCCILIYRYPLQLNFNDDQREGMFARYTKWTSNKNVSNTYHIIAHSHPLFEVTKTTPFYQLKNTKFNMLLNFSFSNQKTFGAAKADIMANESAHKIKLSWTYNGTNDYVSYGYVESEKQYYLQRARVVNGKIVTASAVFPAGTNYDFCYDQAIAFITSVRCEYK